VLTALAFCASVKVFAACTSPSLLNSATDFSASARYPAIVFESLPLMSQMN
jgi:hypothetical protein